VAIAVTGKPFIFAVGADLSGVPTFAFVNGAALGGGLELALHWASPTRCSSRPTSWSGRWSGLSPSWAGT
jgi:hypothetical protein